MKLREFIGKMTASTAVREILPCNQNLLYPQFSVSRERLCLHFIGHTATVTEDGLLIGVPEAYLQVSYSSGEVLGYQSLKYSPDFADTDFTHTTLLPNRAPEERVRRKNAMIRLEDLGDAVLEAWDQSLARQKEDGSWQMEDGFFKLLEEYTEALAEVLEPEQIAAYDRLLRIE